VARVVAFVPDLLFGSNVLGALTAAGHEPVLVSRSEDLPAALGQADVLVVDLTADVDERIAAAASALGDGPPRTLAFFSHVERDVRAEAERAGFDLVVPRSRMARATGELVEQLGGLSG
jgi:uncharacterized protein YbjT (DUF2867 family)